MSIYKESCTYALTDALATTPEITDWGDQGMVFVPTGSSITTLTFHCASAAGGTYHALYKTSNAAVACTMTVAAAKCYQLPADIAGAAAVKMVANAAGNVDVSFQEYA